MLPAFAGTGSASAAAGGRLSGVVRDDGGHVVEGADIRLTDTAGAAAGHDTSDESGRYSVAALPGTYDLMATAGPAGPRMVAHVRGVEVAAESILDLVIIPPDATFSGTIRDGNGSPLEMRITLEGGPQYAYTNSGPDGWFSLPARPGTYRLLLSPSTGWGRNYLIVEDFQLAADRREDMTIPFTDVVVHIRDDRGAPVAGGLTALGCTSCPFELFPGADVSHRWTSSAVPDGNGHAVLRGLPGRATLRTEPPPDQPTLQPTTQAITLPAAHPIQVVMPHGSPPTPPPAPPAFTLRGRLLDGNGQPMEAEMWLWEGGLQVSYASFADDGTFALSAPAGRYDLHIEAVTDTYLGGFKSGDDGIPGLEVTLPDFELTADRTEDLRLPIVEFPVTVLNQAGHPMAGMRVSGESTRTIELFPDGRGTGTLLNNPDTDAAGTARLMVFEGAAPPVVEAGLYDVVGRTTVERGASSAIIHADEPVLQGTVRDSRGLLPEPGRSETWVSFHGGPFSGQFAPWPFGIGGNATYRLQALDTPKTLYVSNDITHPDGDEDGRRGSATLPTFWTFAAPYDHTQDATLDLTIPDAQPADITVVGPDGRPLDGLLSYQTTALRPVELAPGVAAESEARDTIAPAGGRYRPLLFGRSRVSGRFSTGAAWWRPTTPEGGFHFGFGSLSISPGDGVTVAVAHWEGAAPWR
jgi:hypothetical protein